MHHQRVGGADERPRRHLRPPGVLSTARQRGAPKPERQSSFRAEGCFHSLCNRLLGGYWSTAADDAIDHADVRASIHLQNESRRRGLATANSDQNINSSLPADGSRLLAKRLSAGARTLRLCQEARDQNCCYISGCSAQGLMAKVTTGAILFVSRQI